MASFADLPLRRRRRAAGAGTDVIQKAALVLAVLLAAAALLAPLIAPFDPLGQSLIARLRPPLGFERYSAGHLLGTDELGRDVLSRALYGLRLTMSLALVGALIGLLVGGTLGLVAGLRRGWAETPSWGWSTCRSRCPSPWSRC